MSIEYREFSNRLSRIRISRRGFFGVTAAAGSFLLSGCSEPLKIIPDQIPAADNNGILPEELSDGTTFFDEAVRTGATIKLPLTGTSFNNPPRTHQLNYSDPKNLNESITSVRIKESSPGSLIIDIIYKSALEKYPDIVLSGIVNNTPIALRIARIPGDLGPRNSVSLIGLINNKTNDEFKPIENTGELSITVVNGKISKITPKVQDAKNKPT